jgi:hypothetical protein
MSVKIPQNIIVESKYTQGNEYMFIDTNREYQGYYYEINGKTFAGKDFDIYSPELQKITPLNINPFLNKAASYVYGLLSNNNNFRLPMFNSLPKNNNPFTDQSDEEIYYIKKINEIPIKIKQVDKDTYNQIVSNSFYQTIILKANYSNIDQAEQQMPGLKAFLGV